MQQCKSVSPENLRGLPLFAGLPELELAHLCRVSNFRKVPRGTPLVRAGDITDSLYVLLSGSSKVLNSDQEGREVILTILGAGDFFGEMGVLDGAPRSASVFATEACEIMQLSGNEFRRLLSVHPKLAFYFMSRMGQRLREANRKIESLALLDVFGRVAKLLVEFSEIREGCRVLTRKLTKQDIAKMIGASREMVSRVMKDLEAEGFIEVQDGRIVLNET